MPLLTIAKCFVHAVDDVYKCRVTNSATGECRDVAIALVPEQRRVRIIGGIPLLVGGRCTVRAALNMCFVRGWCPCSLCVVL